MGKDYYDRFGIILRSPFFPIYLRWAYRRGLNDVETLGLRPDLTQKDFTCLLSGCGNELTADTFIQFVIQKNKKATIYIIDLGEKQVNAIKKLIDTKYINPNIKVYKVNALEINSIIKPHSLNWIETDGFMEYFDHPSLKKLLQTWHDLLKKDGFVTTRDCITEGEITKIADYVRIKVADLWLGVSLFPHTKQDYEKIFSQIGFKYSFGSTLLYTYRRFALVKSST